MAEWKGVDMRNRLRGIMLPLLFIPINCSNPISTDTKEGIKYLTSILQEGDTLVYYAGQGSGGLSNYTYLCTLQIIVGPIIVENEELKFTVEFTPTLESGYVVNGTPPPWILTPVPSTPYNDTCIIANNIVKRPIVLTINHDTSSYPPEFIVPDPPGGLIYYNFQHDTSITISDTTFLCRNVGDLSNGMGGALISFTKTGRICTYYNTYNHWSTGQSFRMWQLIKFKHKNQS